MIQKDGMTPVTMPIPQGKHVGTPKSKRLVI